MKETGQPGFKRILPHSVAGGSGGALRIAVVAADYSLIVWWAQAMATAADKLSQLRAFLKGRDVTELDAQDLQFRKRRTDLENAMVKAVRRNTSSFDDPWGLVALFMAANQTAHVNARVVSSSFTLSLGQVTPS